MESFKNIILPVFIFLAVAFLLFRSSESSESEMKKELQKENIEIHLKSKPIRSSIAIKKVKSVLPPGAEIKIISKSSENSYWVYYTTEKGLFLGSISLGIFTATLSTNTCIGKVEHE